MAKALKTAAFVVGAVALAATGIGAAVGASGLFLGVAGSTFATIGTIAGVASAVLSVAATSLAPKPKGTIGGSATKFTINKESGYPYIMGRTYSGGRVVHRQFYGEKNAYESWVTVHSIGPVKSLGALEIDRVPVTFSGGAATGGYSGYMWLTQQLGACPEPSAMAGPVGAIPGWSSSAKLSGLAADLWTLKFDTEGKKFPTGVPQRGRVIEGVYVYDPRQDSTYPGGSGACRLGNEATYVWSDNPALHAITWAYGRIQNNILIAGGGLAVNGIDLAPFVEWANVCEVNNWRVGGIVYTADDDSWDVLKMIAQAGGAEVMPVGALLSCTFSAPRVSIGLITTNDIVGDVDVPSSSSRRTRRNTVIPRVRLESHGWEMVPLDAVEIPDYISVDGGRRPKEVILPLVQQANQGVQLGLYEILNERELDPIVLPCKVYALGYRPGDCLTVDIPIANLISREVVVREREINASDLSVTLTCRTETAGKHPFALGKTGTPPPTPDLTVPEYYPVPGEPGISPISVSTLPAAITIQAGPSGSPLIGELPAAIGNSATQAGFDVPITSISIVSQNACTATVVGTDVRITAVAGAMGDVVYDVTASGQTERKRVTFSVIMAGSDGTRAQAITITNNFSWSAYQQHGDTVAINASPSGKLSVNLTGSMRVALDAGEMRFQSKLQYRVAGGTWVDIAGSEAISTKSETLVDPVRVLAAQVNGAGPYALTGLSANAAYEVRALTRWYDGDVYPVTTNLRLYAEQVA
jgi:hypothetical protein